MAGQKQSIEKSLIQINDELQGVIDYLKENPTALEDAATLIGNAPRIFVFGAGRSGLALKMLAMRLMHLGKTTYVVGETTTPGIHAGDLLILASGSGTTPSVVANAQRAKDENAQILAITTQASSPLAQLADVVVPIPAAVKLDRTDTASVQYAGSLFEESVVIIGDTLFHTLWQRSGKTGDDIWPNHANLE